MKGRRRTIKGRHRAGPNVTSEPTSGAHSCRPHLCIGSAPLTQYSKAADFVMLFYPGGGVGFVVPLRGLRDCSSSPVCMQPSRIDAQETSPQRRLAPLPRIEG
jgi:hypothetical protein